MAETKLMNELFEGISSKFSPYVECCQEADAINVYFHPDADYSKRLTDHVTLFISIDTGRLVGCRIKGIAGILEDLPNYIHVDDGEIKLRLIFWSFRGSVETPEERSAINELTKEAGELVLSH